MTRYYVKISSALVAQIQTERCTLPEGWRLVERFGPRYPDQECWLVEDALAGEEFEGFLVTPYITMTLNEPDNPSAGYISTVTDREIVTTP